jgi:N-acetyl-anhydromuramyl-L-alanine amidase AmpD
MIIDKEAHILNENNFFPVRTIKKQIILGNTYNSDMKHILSWKNRLNGNYKKTAHFTISESGEIFNHFDPEFQSSFFNDRYLDSKSIIILIENIGWVEKDEKNRFITMYGDIYKNADNVITKKWREHEFWVKYNEKQVESVLELINHLSEEFYIPKTVFGHNTKIDDLSDYQGVLYKSNLEKHYNDLTPAWDFKYFKSKLEKK